MKILSALIIDNSASMASALSAILRDNLKFGTIYKAKSGEHGLQIFKNESVDWIFCEAELPGMSGLELLNAVRRLPQGRIVQFVIVASLTDKESIAEFLNAGASDIIAKPFNITTITEKVLRVHGALIKEAQALKPVLTVVSSQKSNLKDAEGPRRNRRVMLNDPYPCQISFTDSGGQYESNMINISLTGGLVRCEPFKRGGAIYDLADLNLQGVHGERILIKAMLVRMTVDQKSSYGDYRTMLAEFRFQSMDDARRKAIKDLLIENARTEGLL